MSPFPMMTHSRTLFSDFYPSPGPSPTHQGGVSYRPLNGFDREESLPRFIETR